MAENGNIEFTENRTVIYALQEQIEQLQKLEYPYEEPIKYPIDGIFSKDYVYVIVHEHVKIDTGVFVFQNLVDAVAKATELAEDHIFDQSSIDEIEQRYYEGMVYCLYYPIEGYVWIVRREIQ